MCLVYIWLIETFRFCKSLFCSFHKNNVTWNREVSTVMFVDIHLKAQMIALPLNSHTRSWVRQPCTVLELARFVHQIISVKASGYVTNFRFFCRGWNPDVFFSHIEILLTCSLWEMLQCLHQSTVIGCTIQVRLSLHGFPKCLVGKRHKYLFRSEVEFS